MIFIIHIWIYVLITYISLPIHRNIAKQLTKKYCKGLQRKQCATIFAETIFPERVFLNTGFSKAILPKTLFPETVFSETVCSETEVTQP